MRFRRIGKQGFLDGYAQQNPYGNTSGPTKLCDLPEEFWPSTMALRLCDVGDDATGLDKVGIVAVYGDVGNPTYNGSVFLNTPDYTGEMAYVWIGIDWWID